MRILVIRTSALGDSVLATPALRALGAHFPEAELHFVTNDHLAPLFEGLPFLTRVWPWKMGGGSKTAKGLPRFAASLVASGHFDLVIDLQNSIATRLLVARLHGTRVLRFVKRTGFREVASSIFGEGPILDEVPAAAHFLQTLTPLGIPQLGTPLRPELRTAPAADRVAGEVLAEGGDQPLVALAPGARWPLKRWDPLRFAEVGDALAAEGARIVLVGGPGDRRELDQVRGALHAAPIADTRDLDLPTLTAVIARTRLLVSCDSGPSHVAQAVGTPVVVVFGPTSTRRWGPIPGAGVAVSLPLACAPCSNFGRRPCPLGHHACMVDLQAQPVIDASLAAFRAGREGGAEAAAAIGSRDRVGLALYAARSGREVRR